MTTEVNQKIQDIIDNDIPFLINREKGYKGSSMSDIEKEAVLEHDITRLAEKLFRSNLHELKSQHEKIRTQETELLRETVSLMNAKRPVPDELSFELSKAQILLKAIDKAITLKREYNRHSIDHPMDNNMITSGLFVTSSPKPKSLKKYEKTEVDETAGVKTYIEIDRKKISYRNTRCVVLSHYDGRVFLSVTKNWILQGRPRTISLELKDICREMNATPSGGEYKTIRNSLENIFATEVIMKEYYDPEVHGIYSTKEYFRIFDHLKFIARSQDEENRERKVEVTLHDKIYKSMLSGNYVLLNMMIYTELPTAFARICYQHIIKAAVHGIRTLDIDELLNLIQVETGNRARAAHDVEQALVYLKDQDVITEYRIRGEGSKNKKYVDFEPSNWILHQNKQSLLTS